MKKLIVPRFDLSVEAINLPTVVAMLGEEERHPLSYAPWHAFAVKPEVQVAMAHNSNHLLLAFYVKEKTLLAANDAFQSPVYEDSCVECFLMFGEDQEYYNLEMNCTGALLLGYGAGRDDRKQVSTGKLKNISRQVVISREAGMEFVSWQLTAVIPVDVFEHHAITSLNGMVCRGNFYKCGDLLPEPHFLCWSEIRAPEPDFHLPGFFGQLEFC